MNILVVEDNPDLIENLFDYFESRGHVVDAAYNGKSGLVLIQQNVYDVIVLDLLLPDMDGLDICKHIRQFGFDLPVLMLTARDTLEYKILGFESGADDYLVKPFALNELEVRLQALVRRAHGEISSTPLIVGDLEFNPLTLIVKREGKKIELPPIPLKILELLMRQSPRVISRQEIQQHIWGEDLPETDVLRVHLYTLRNLIDKQNSNPLIHTVRGMGYCIVEPDEN